MKVIFYVLLSVILFQIEGMSQTKEATISFDKTVNNYKMLPNQQMRANFPEFTTTHHVLLLSDTVSFFKTIVEEDAPDPFAGTGGNGGGMRMMFRAGAGGDIYKIFPQATTIVATEVFGKSFLIVDSIKKMPWKLTTDTKSILGYTCRKAILKTTQPAQNFRRMTFGGEGAPRQQDTTIKPAAPREITVEAWFAETITVPAGPDTYGQLPGTILELNVDNSAIVYTATAIKSTVDPKQLKEPKKGKKVTQQEFRKMMMELMQNQMGGGNINIRLNN